jgi:hypothetical protein
LSAQTPCIRRAGLALLLGSLREGWLRTRDDGNRNQAGNLPKLPMEHLLDRSMVVGQLNGRQSRSRIISAHCAQIMSEAWLFRCELKGLKRELDRSAKLRRL